MGRNGVFRQLFVLTMRQALGRRRAVIAVLAGAIPVLVAVIYRLVSGEDPQGWSADLLNGIVVTTLLPLVALIFGTSVLGGEIEDGTIVYLLVRPVPRREIVAAKILVAATTTTVIVGVSAAVALLVSLPGSAGYGLVVASVVGIAWGALIYATIAVVLSLFTTHALIVGLIYVYLWEGVIAGLFAGTRLASVHQYVLGVAAALDPIQPSALPAHLSLAGSVGLGALVAGAATVLAVWRLAGFEVAERP